MLAIFHFFTSLCSLLIFLLLATTSPATSSPVDGTLPASPIELTTSPPTSTNVSSTDFIRACCARTLYPRLCFASLAPAAASIHSDHARLAVAAANVTLGSLRSLAARISSLRGSSSGGGGALQDCADAVASAGDLAWRAAERLAGLEEAVGPEVMWRVGDAQAWLSAAMTDEDTCADELQSAKPAPSPAGAEVLPAVCRGMKHTSIALALVNLLVRN